MDNIIQTNNIKYIENQIKNIRLKIENNSTLEELHILKKELIDLEKENLQMKQKVTSYMVALMHQRRKAAENVDDQYFEHEIFIETHEELNQEILKQLQDINKLI